MKKKALLFLAFAIAFAGFTAEFIHLAPSTAPAAFADAPPEMPRRMLNPGDKFEIDAADLRVKLFDNAEDERPEQIADWVVYATLLYMGVPGGELRNSLYDRPPMRLPVLEESVNFDYGPGRRVVMADKSVWLFRSATDPHPMATLARLADQARMELGEKPERFAVFTYQSILTDGVIEVRRDPDVSGASMYSPEYGYIETKAANLEGFDSWLKQIDDVVHVRKLDDQTIELGGRRMLDARTEGVTLEYVASLYQGHQRIAENHRLSDGTMPSEPGFSLDPLWDGAGLIRDFERLLEEPKSLVAETRKLAGEASNYPDDSRPILMTVAVDVAENVPAGVDISDERRAQIIAAIDALRGKPDTSLGDGPIVPLLDLEHELNEAAGEVALNALVKYVMAKHHCQCARYDGPMQGTFVGMNLFYTDLLAKLWASVDYRRAAPVAEVVGFRSGPEAMATTAPAFWQEMWEKPNTRLWFGPKTEGYARSEDSSVVNFAHIATRVFSKGSNARKPGIEESPSEDSRQVFHWWDRQFERVADYEQQYHTQNQIMKWSVITGWAATNQLLGFLDTPSIPIRRDLRFDQWYAQNDSLRFRGDVRMLPESQWRGGTECMEILRSYSVKTGGAEAFIEGGVSLGGAKTLTQEGAAVAQRVSPTLRRAGLTFDGAATGTFRNFKATQFEMPAGATRTVITPKIGNFLRSGATEFRVTKFETELVGGAAKGAFKIAADGQEFGRLTFQNAERGVQLAWRDAPARFAERLTKLTAGVQDGKLPPFVSRNIQFVEAQNGKLEAIVRIGDAGEPRAFAVSAGEPPSNAFVEVGSGLRGEHRVGATFIKIADANRRLRSQDWQRVTAENTRMTRVFTNNGPAATAKPLKLKSSAGVEIDAFADGGVVYLRRSESYANFESLVEREGFTPEFVQNLLQKGQNAVATPAALQSPGARAASAVERGDVSEAMAQLAGAAKKGSLDHALRDFGSRYGGETQRALTGARSRLSVDYTAIRGTDADACIRRALIATEKRDLSRAAQELTQVVGRGGPSKNLMQFMQEMPESPDLGVIRRFTQAADDGATPAFLKQVRIEARKNALHTIADIDGHVSITAVADKARLKQIITDTGQPFFVDRRLLAHSDWDGAPGVSLHSAIKDPNVIWEDLTVDGMGGFRPSQLLHKQTTAVTMHVTGSESANLQSFIEAAARGQRVLRLRSRPCQKDDPRSECANTRPAVLRREG